MSTELHFPWFDKVLNPNTKCYWRYKYNASKKQKDDAYYVALAEPKPEPKDKYALYIRFYPPCNRRRDLDNCLASIKGLLDGVAEAWGVDDSDFVPIPLFGEKVKHGNIVITVE